MGNMVGLLMGVYGLSPFLVMVWYFVVLGRSRDRAPSPEGRPIGIVVAFILLFFLCWIHLLTMFLVWGGFENIPPAPEVGSHIKTLTQAVDQLAQNTDDRFARILREDDSLPVEKALGTLTSIWGYWDYTNASIEVEGARFPATPTTCPKPDWGDKIKVLSGTTAGMSVSVGAKGTVTAANLPRSRPMRARLAMTVTYPVSTPGPGKTFQNGIAEFATTFAVLVLSKDDWESYVSWRDYQASVTAHNERYASLVFHIIVTLCIVGCVVWLHRFVPSGSSTSPSCQSPPTAP